MRRVFMMLLTLSMLMMCMVANAAAIKVTDAKWGVSKENILRLVVDATDKVGYDINLEGQTLVLTVNAPAESTIPASRAVRSSLAKTMTVSKLADRTVVKLPLTKTITVNDYKSFVLKQDPVNKRPFRVVVDVTADKREPAPVATATTATATAGKATVAAGPVVGNKPTRSTGTATAKTESKATVVKRTETPVKTETKATDTKKTETKKTETKKTETKTTTDKKDDIKVVKGSGKYKTSGGVKGKVITLDAGHGGTDPGAIGKSGVKEKNITLAITKLVQQRLTDLGAKVYMTRTTDVDVAGPYAADAAELQARVNVAEEHDSDLFISLHINASVNKDIGGFSSYYYSKTAYDKKIASCIQKELSGNFNVDNLGIREANFYVVKRCSMPATLIEMLFISNPKEEELMQSAWYQKKAARLIVDGIVNYFE